MEEMVMWLPSGQLMSGVHTVPWLSTFDDLLFICCQVVWYPLILPWII